MEEAELFITPTGVDPAVANQLVGDLDDSLTQDVPGIDHRRERADPLSQDFGATLVIVLSSAAVTALARGIAVWLARRQDAKLHLKWQLPGGLFKEIEVDGPVSDRVERIIADFLSD